MKKISLVVLICIMLGSCLTACGFSNGIGDYEIQENDLVLYNQDGDIMDSGPVKGGTINLFSTIPDTLNPVMTSNIFVQKFSSLVYESLVSVSKEQKPQAMLSDSWDVSDDGMVWTFHIREGIYWHDNVPFTADDVEFSMKTTMRKDIDSPYKNSFHNIATFAAVDSSHFRVVLRKPDSFAALMMTLPIIPHHCFIDDNMTDSIINTHPIGTGAYKFRAYEEGKSLMLESNENWWNAGIPEDAVMKLPYIDEVVIKFDKDIKDGISRFQSREVDLYDMRNMEFYEYYNRTDMIVKKYTGSEFEFIAFNLINPLTADNALRKAIFLAIDRQKLIAEDLSNCAVAADMPVIPESWLYGADKPALYETDKNAAMEILLQNEWKQENGRFYKYIDGKKAYAVLELLVNSDNGRRIRLAGKISSQLEEIGIIIKVKKISWEEEFRMIDSGKYDMVFLGSSVTATPDLSYLYSRSYRQLYLPSGADAGRNISQYNNAAVSGMIEEMYTKNDDETRKQLLQKIHLIVTEDVPYIGLWFNCSAVLYNKEVRGDIKPYVWNKLNNFREWYVTSR